MPDLDLDALPPVCEIADLITDRVFEWADPDDGRCEGGTWLLLGEDAPSPLCSRHAEMLAARLSETDLADTKLVRA